MVEEKHIFFSYLSHRSLSRNIILTLVGAVTILSASSIIMHLIVHSTSNRTQFDQISRQMTDNLTEIIEYPLWNYDTDSISQIGRMIMNNESISALTIKDDKGSPLFSREKESAGRDQHKNIKISHLGKEVGTLDIWMTQERYKEQQRDIIVFGVFTILILIAGITVTVIFSVTRLINQPLEEFSKSIDSLAKGDFEGKPLITEYTELTKLVARFNQMTSKIKVRERKILRANVDLKVEIEERRQVEKQLKQFKTIIEQADEEVVITDPDGKILYVNPSFEKNTGFTCDETVGRNPSILKSGLHKKPFYDDLWTTILSKKSWKGIFKNKSRSGEIRIHDTVITPIVNKENQITAFVSIRRDITEQIQMEQRIDQAQKMQAIGTLAGGIAHDFNNILAGIFGYCQLAQINLDNPKKVNEYISKTVKASKRATDLVQQILTFSRQTEYEKKPFMAYPEVNEALKLLRSSIPVTIKIEKNLNSTARILADPGKIHQVVMNLCTNAYHAMRKTGGTMKVCMSDMMIENRTVIRGKVMPPGRYLLLEIHDNGQGMDEQIIEKAFDPYFTTKKKGEGTGLGLAIVQAIVDEHDGFLDIRSQVGTGTSIFAYFPVVEEQKPDPKEDAETSTSIIGAEKIMLVDDEEDIRLTYRDMLENFGYQIALFEDGNSALESFHTDPDMYNLIISDMTMPDMTGDRLISEIKAVRPELPVILFSGYSELINEDSALKMGASCYLMKPVIGNDLAKAVREALDKKDAHIN